MDLRLVLAALLLVQSVLPAPICAGALARCAEGRDACVAACTGGAVRSGCCVPVSPCMGSACERGDDGGRPCEPVCVPCPLGQPMAPTRAPTQATPADLALLPAGSVLIIEGTRGRTMPRSCLERHGPFVGPEFRSLLCIWLI